MHNFFALSRERKKTFAWHNFFALSREASLHGTISLHSQPKQKSATKCNQRATKLFEAKSATKCNQSATKLFEAKSATKCNQMQPKCNQRNRSACCMQNFFCIVSLRSTLIPLLSIRASHCVIACFSCLDAFMACLLPLPAKPCLLPLPAKPCFHSLKSYCSYSIEESIYKEEEDLFSNPSSKVVAGGAISL